MVLNVVKLAKLSPRAKIYTSPPHPASYSGVSSNAFGSNEFASNDPFKALSHLQSNDPKFRSNGNYSGNLGSNFKLLADR